jgi:uncharacterized protein YndB with AHSA1/START domain
MITTHLFAFFTAAPSEHVWAALTDAEHTGQYLQGVTLRSDWRPGSPVTFVYGDIEAARGDVVAAEPNSRLSLAIEGGHGPATIVTWELRAAAGGTVVRLYVDEPGDEDAGERQEVEDTWLASLADLQGILAAGVPT